MVMLSSPILQAILDTSRQNRLVAKLAFFAQLQGINLIGLFWYLYYMLCVEEERYELQVLNLKTHHTFRFIPDGATFYFQCFRHGHEVFTSPIPDIQVLEDIHNMIHEKFKSELDTFAMELYDASALPKLLMNFPEELDDIKIFELTPQTKNWNEYFMKMYEVLLTYWGKDQIPSDCYPIPHVFYDILTDWTNRRDALFYENPGYRGPIKKVTVFTQFSSLDLYTLAVLGHKEKEDETFLFALYVDKEYQGEGYGSKLLAEVTNYLETNKYKCSLPLQTCIQKANTSKSYKNMLLKAGWRVSDNSGNTIVQYPYTDGRVTRSST